MIKSNRLPGPGPDRIDAAPGPRLGTREARRDRCRDLGCRTRPPVPVRADGIVAVRHHGEPFRLFRRKGRDEYRVTFCISGVRYEGSTRCPEHDLAVMVARVLYTEVKESAGRLARDDERRTTRSVRTVHGYWLNLRPKRLPSTVN